MVTIPIYLHPLAWHVLRRDCPTDRFAINIVEAWYYPFLKMVLERDRQPTNRELTKTPADFRQGMVYIRRTDYRDHGGYVSRYNCQYLSNAICSQERERLCSIILTAHVFAGLPVQTVIKQILASGGFSDDEINLENLRKHYQRHYAKQEPANMHDLQEIIHSKR